MTSRSPLILLLAALLLALTALRADSSSPGNLEVIFLNVGQGDSALLRDSTGFDALIDGGSPEAGPALVARLRAAMTAAGQPLDDLDVLVAPHPDSDHIGGLVDVLAAADIPVEQVLYNGYQGDTPTWTAFLAAAAARGLAPAAVQYPADLDWGEMTVHVLNPPAGLADPETNDASLVLRVDHGQVNFLFPADIPSTVEAQVLARGTPVAAEVLKVAHHGSADASSTSFLAAVGPRDSILSVGQNDYGHPAAETIQRLLDAGSSAWRTDLNGDITVRSDGDAYKLTVQKVPTTIYGYLPLVYNQPAPPPQTTGLVTITRIFYDGAAAGEADEYVQIRNADDHAIALQGWTLRDLANHTFTFPAATIRPGQVCRVYTNQAHPEWCSFSYHSASPIWNNTPPECAYLRNASGALVSKKCY